MTTTYFLDKAYDLKNKFKKFFISKKKLKALSNYAEAVPTKHKTYLTLIKKCSDDGFLGEREADFLSYMIDLYDINYLDWSHKTRWLKQKITTLADEQKKQEAEQLDLFAYEKKPSPVKRHLMTVNNINQTTRRV
jgi:hypothetical protein